MTALTANQQINSKSNFKRKYYPVLTGAIHIYKGAIVMGEGSGGYATVGADTSGCKFLGIATQELNQATGGSSGDNVIEVIPMGSGDLVLLPTGTIARTDVGTSVYIKDSGAVDLVGVTTNDVLVGVIREFVTTTSAYVQI